MSTGEVEPPKIDAGPSHPLVLPVFTEGSFLTAFSLCLHAGATQGAVFSGIASAISTIVLVREILKLKRNK